MGHENRFALIKTYKERQDKFVYYITGLSVAAIAFTVSKTFDTNLTYSDVFMGGAVMCWFVSIAASISWIFIQLTLMEMNLDLADLNDGYTNNLERINNDEKKRIQHDLVAKFKKRNGYCNFFFKTMLIAFLFGVIAFIVWRVVILV